MACMDLDRFFFPGYADIENPVFFRETTQMLLGLGGEVEQVTLQVL